MAHTVPHGMCGRAAGVENIRWPRIKPLYYHSTAGSRARPCGLWPSLPCLWPSLPCSWPPLPRCEQVNIKVFLAAVCCPCLYFTYKVDNQFYQKSFIVSIGPLVTKQLTLSAENTFQMNLQLCLWLELCTSGARDSIRICINWQGWHFVEPAKQPGGWEWLVRKADH